MSPTHDTTIADDSAAKRAIATWLLVCCGLVFATVVLGGVTRLTGSGLSMAEWRPIMGMLPPLNDAEWQRVFELYQQTPEFIKVNPGMDVHGFKGIFWLEYLSSRASTFLSETCRGTCSCWRSAAHRA